MAILSFGFTNPKTCDKKLLCDKEWRPMGNRTVSDIKIVYGSDNVYSLKLNDLETNGTWYFDSNEKIHIDFYDNETQTKAEIIASIIQVGNDTLILEGQNNKLMTYTTYR
jgi:hypothetical protein